MVQNYRFELNSLDVFQQSTFW